MTCRVAARRQGSLPRWQATRGPRGCGLRSCLPPGTAPGAIGM